MKHEVNGRSYDSEYEMAEYASAIELYRRKKMSFSLLPIIFAVAIVTVVFYFLFRN